MKKIHVKVLILCVLFCFSTTRSPVCTDCNVDGKTGTFEGSSKPVNSGATGDGCKCNGGDCSGCSFGWLSNNVF